MSQVIDLIDDFHRILDTRDDNLCIACRSRSYDYISSSNDSLPNATREVDTPYVTYLDFSYVD